MKLKVCGMKHNTAEVAALEPDYLGFIFWEPSVRFFNGDPSSLPSGPDRVGVFVNASIEEVVSHISDFKLDAIQLHGHESSDYCGQLKKILGENASSSILIIKAFAVDEHFNFERLNAYENICDYFLFDTRGDIPGGTGKSFDWNLLKDYSLTKPYFLSGGIGPENVESLLDFFERPEARYCEVIDVNSKFEIKPGLKDTGELKIFKNKLASGLQKN